MQVPTGEACGVWEHLVPVTRMYGRRVRREPHLVSLAFSIATELSAAADRTLVEVVAHGDSSDYQEWITVRFHARATIEEEPLAEEFAKRITRYGALAV